MDLLDFLRNKIKTAHKGQIQMAYRLDLLKALIDSYPKGYPLTNKELYAVLDYRPDSAAMDGWMHRLEDSGEIKRTWLSRGTNSYTVLKPGNTYTQERKIQESKEDIPEAENASVELDSFPQPLEQKVYTVLQLEQLAMRYDFYSSHMGNVPGFLMYLKEQ